MRDYVYNDPLNEQVICKRIFSFGIVNLMAQFNTFKFKTN